MPISATQTVGTVYLTALVAISLVLLTGWAGQASFGQFGLAAVGALAAGALANKLGLTFWLAVPIATLIAAAVGLLLAFPALRIRGLFLVPVTFSFAIVASDLFFSTKFFGWLQPGTIHRPQLFVDFEDSNAMYFLCLACLVIGAIVARNLRRSRFGRLVIATRENESDVQAHGIGVLWTKLSVFGVAAAFAGFAGAMLAFDQQAVNQSFYTYDQSQLAFEMVIVGGASSLGGALLGVAVIFGLGQTPALLPGIGVFLPTVPLLVLYFAPGGLLTVLASARDMVLRIVAQRSQMIVPSLFTDIDPQALQLQLIPLAAAVGGSAPGGFRLAHSFWSRLSADGRQQSQEAALLSAVAGDAASVAGTEA
jgi:ABC-type branched-subunit amino acid transport system permease subunit